MPQVYGAARTKVKRKRRPRPEGWLSRREYQIQQRCERWGVPYKKISRTKVFKRDKWICQLCMTPVDPKCRWPNKRCASIDHIIPVSVKGSPGHVWTNVQLAHFDCNSRKGAGE